MAFCHRCNLVWRYDEDEPGIIHWRDRRSLPRLRGAYDRASPKNFASQSAAWIETLADHTPSASNEVVTCAPCPVRSRR